MSDGERSIPRRLWDLSAPVVGLNVLAVLALAIDTAMCGRLPNADIALTALGFATQVVFLLMVAMIGLTVGTVALVSRAHGAGDNQRVNHLLAQASMLTILVGVVVALIGNPLAKDVLRLLGASEVVLDDALAYLRPLLTGAVFYYLNILYAGILRGVGNTRLPFVIALASTALNIGLNYGFILGNYGLPALGVRGAAYGTVLSYAFSVTMMVASIKRGVIDGLSLSLRPRAIDRPLAWELFKVGAPAALDMVVVNAAFMSIVGMLGRIDTIAVAAHGIGLRIQALAFVPGLSVSQATSAMVGQALGSGDAAEARRIVRAAVAMCTALMTVLAVTIVGFVDEIIALFEVAPQSSLAEYSTTWIELLGYGMPLVGIWIGFVGMLQGAGDTRTGLKINSATTLVFQIPLSFILGFWLDWSALGVWLAFPACFVIRAVLGVIVYKRGRWAKLGLQATSS